MLIIFFYFECVDYLIPTGGIVRKFSLVYKDCTITQNINYL